MNHVARKIHSLSTGIAYLHAQNLIHGDIKGKNILLGHDLNPKICDFGISKFYNDGVTSTDTRHAGSIAYMSHELLLMGESKTRESDVYALGVTIFEARPILVTAAAGRLLT